MKSFRSFVTTVLESQHIKGHPTPNQVLMNVLHGLSSPAGVDDPHEGARHVTEALMEVTVFDQNNPKLATRKVSRTLGMIGKAKSEGLDEKSYKDVYAGFKKANQSIATEDDESLRVRAAQARKAYESFAKERGFKSRGSLLIENGKTRKSSGEGVYTRGISLAPHTTSGLNKFDSCPRASKECRANCLGTEAGGNRMFADSALSSKVLKTHFMLAHPEHFAHLLHHEITQHKAEAKAEGMVPGIRLNVTSDIPYEKHLPAIFHKHKDVQFYDYTKIHQRVMDQTKTNHPENYHLTLSHTGANHEESNDHHAVAALNAGHVVAMVYQRGKDVPTPHHVEDMQSGKRWRVAGGDDDDNTFDRKETHNIPHEEGVVSGLELKGVKNSDAVHFANKVDADGVIRINQRRNM